MKIGDKVKLKHEITYPAKDEYGEACVGRLAVGSIGIVANMVDAGGELLVFFNPVDTDAIYAVARSSVVKVKH